MKVRPELEIEPETELSEAGDVPQYSVQLVPVTAVAMQYHVPRVGVTPEFTPPTSDDTCNVGVAESSRPMANPAAFEAAFSAAKTMENAFGIESRYAQPQYVRSVPSPPFVAE